MKYIVNKQIDSAILSSLYNNEALTIEGLNLDDIDEYAKYLNDIVGLKTNATFHVITGRKMNDAYCLYGRRAYPYSLNIVAIKLEDFLHPGAIVLKRFEFGGRWFSDIVDNNAM